MLLAYADDIIILSDNMEDLNRFMREFADVAIEAGLLVNPLKSEIMIRDPHSNGALLPDTLPIGNFHIKVTNKLKYLGIYLTDGLNRPMIVRERIKTAFKAAYALLPFLRKNRLSIALLTQIYRSIIVPVATFGLKGSAMTKRNRLSLTRMERHIIRLFLDTSNERVGKMTTRARLQGKTIVKRVIVHRVRYHRHIERRDRNHILQVARRFKIDAKNKVGRPCYIWEDTLNIETRKVGHPEVLQSALEEGCDMAAIELAIFESQISEEEEEE